MSASGSPRQRHVQIVGLGLIGSSVGLALRSAGWQVSGMDLDLDRAQRALELGVVDRLGEDPNAEVAVVATPVAAVAEVARRLIAASPTIVVTDVGGVKGPIVGALDEPRFVGGHPMAGSEQTGPDGASGDLFAGATWVLTPISRTDQAAYQLVRELVGLLGADAVALSPERHDALVAVVSHVPHLAAAALMVLAAESGDQEGPLLRLAAGGFRDMTRIAAGEPGIWPDIFRDNSGAVLEVLERLIAKLQSVRDLVATNDRRELITLLSRAQTARRNLPGRVARPEELIECRIPVLDRPGVLAEVTTVLGELGVNIFDLEIAHSSEGERGVLVLAIEAEAGEKARSALADRGYRPLLGGLS